MGKHFQCLHSNDDSACSITSNFFAKSYEIADHKAKKDDCAFNNVKFVMDSVLQRVEGNISKYEAAKNKLKKCHSYTVLFKADVINKLIDGFLQGEVAEHFRISQSQVK